MRAIIRPLVRATLRNSTVLEARDAVQALELLRGPIVDLMLVDLNLPQLSGFELISLVRKAPDSQNPMVPILVVSSSATVGTVRDVRNCGANGFLAKPFTAAAMSNAILKVIADDRPFVRTASYFGPDRRRKLDLSYQGPQRRKADQAADPAPTQE